MKLIFKERIQRREDIFSFLFEKPQDFTFAPGQFMFYTLPFETPDNRGVTRYFSISSTPFEDFIMITTRISPESSTFKKTLMKLKPGDEIEATGPDGQFVIENSARDLVFIAGGIGITPFRPMLFDIAGRNPETKAVLLYGNKDDNPVFKEEFEALADKLINLKIQYFISPVHIDRKIINRQLSIVNNPVFYISGPSSFVRIIRDEIKLMGIEKENIKLDYFSGYDT